MLATKQNTRLFSLSFFLTLLVIVYLLPVDIAHSQNLQSSPSPRTDLVSPSLQGNRHLPEERVTVLVTLRAQITGPLNAFLNQNGVHVRAEMKTLSTVSLSLPFRKVPQLASFPEILHVSADQPVSALGHISNTTGAISGEAAVSAAGRGVINGTGLSIAIVDSGIDVNHAQFAAAGGGSRVVASVDFTGENRTDDPYGHGTFVAAAAAGGPGAGAEYTGIVPGGSLVNGRVLDRTRVGTVEKVLAGLEGIAEHARQYNIRIVNLSL